MKLKQMREAAPSGEDVFAAYRAAREELARRRSQFGQLDKAARSLEKAARGMNLPANAKAASWKARQELAGKLDPRSRRRGIGLLIIGLGVGVGVGYLIAQRQNRERVAAYARGVSEKARPVVEEVVSKVRNGSLRQNAEEIALLAEVEPLLVAEKSPGDLRAAVEGRTVYLRGELAADRARQLADKIRQLPGVAAVVNLTMTPAGAGEAAQPASQAAARSSS
jgi:osmotically-inducible protein OsmY